MSRALNVGNLVDEVTILRIKVARLDGGKRQMAKRELDEKDFLGLYGAPEALVEKLSRINAELWELEDVTRHLTAECDFGAAWRAVKAQITHLNDERARVKRQINEACGSEIVEVKSHAGC
jgi:hypothetical protein